MTSPRPDIRYHLLMSRAGGGSLTNRAGFVLAGGGSTRMGRDKALLPLQGGTMIGRIAGLVRAAAGSVTLIGPPGRYASLGFPVMPDQVEGCGPLGGVLTALNHTTADWNLIVACDLPDLTPALLEDLFRAAEAGDADAVVPESEGGLDPLCAIYHRRCAAAAASAIGRKIFKMHDFLSSIQFHRLPVSDSRVLSNINTAEQWNAR